MLPTDPAARAVVVWNRLVADHAGRSLLRRPTLHEEQSRRQVALWPYSQAMHARSLVRGCTASVAEPAGPPMADLAPMLRRYALGAAFADRPGGQHRYLDDNAWVALAQWQHRRLVAPGAEPSRESLDLLGWLAQHVDDEGGVLWREGVTSRHACSTGAVGVALALVGSPGSPAHEAAQRCASFLRSVLADETGFVRDNIDVTGHVEPTRWIYNQALLVRVETALADVVDEPEASQALTRADDALRAGLDAFDADALWQQPVAFVAIWARAVLARAAQGRQTTVVDAAEAAVRAYSTRLVEHLDVNDGRVGSPDQIGRYGNGESDVLDRAAAVQMLALAALNRDQRLAVV